MINLLIWQFYAIQQRYGLFLVTTMKYCVRKMHVECEQGRVDLRSSFCGTKINTPKGLLNKMGEILLAHGLSFTTRISTAN